VGTIRSSEHAVADHEADPEIFAGRAGAFVTQDPGPWLRSSVAA
jgi:hypothetical protein